MVQYGSFNLGEVYPAQSSFPHLLKNKNTKSQSYSFKCVISQLWMNDEIKAEG